MAYRYAIRLTGRQTDRNTDRIVGERVNSLAYQGKYLMRIIRNRQINPIKLVAVFG